MSASPVIAIGASAGGVEALIELLAALPAAMPAPVVVVIHLPQDGSDALARVLDRAGPLPVEAAADGQSLTPGTVAVAPPGSHLLVEPDALRLADGPPIDGMRPSIDRAFATLAAAYGARAVAVLLSGTLDDGSRGMAAVKAAGGLALVQSPEQARHPSMVQSALRATDVDAVLPVAALAHRLAELAQPASLAAGDGSSSASWSTATRLSSASRSTGRSCGPNGAATGSFGGPT